jgi:hypothetical protein
MGTLKFSLVYGIRDDGTTGLQEYMKCISEDGLTETSEYIKGSAPFWKQPVQLRAWWDSMNFQDVKIPGQYDTVINISNFKYNIHPASYVMIAGSGPEPWSLYNTLDTVEDNLYCYPLIVPTIHDNTLDARKTASQSIKIEYIEDSVNEQFIFYVFPTSKTLDVEFLNILINDTIYEQDIYLDLIRENIETNRFIIPFSELFIDSDKAIVEFKTFGKTQTVQPILVHRTKLSPLWKKDITTYDLMFKTAPDITEEYVSPTINSSRIPYLPMGAFGWGKEGYGGTINWNNETGIAEDGVFGYGGFKKPNPSKLFKLSNVGNVMLDGSRIVNVFNSFFYDDTDDMIITSDTITHITSIPAL